jgi:type III pantothenate kinase
MNLYVDVGNSRIKWKHDGMAEAMVADSLQQLNRQWDALKAVKLRAAGGSCVRGRLLADKINALSQACFDIPVAWQSSVTEACGVTNAYAQPQNLGVDRWAALIAARVRYPNQACIVVDAGTAITVDLLDATGLHLGGVILPGAASMLDTLNRAEQLFPDASRDLHEFAKSVPPFASSTQDAVLAGIVFAVQGGVKAVIEQQAAQINVKIATLPIILTGGDSTMLNLDSLQTQQVPDLVLEGLRVLMENGK